MRHALSLVLLFCCHYAIAQSQPSAALVRQLVRKSAYIFSGQVLSVDSQPSGVPVVRVTFKVEKGIRGVRSGEVFSIHEWAPVWNSSPRYRKGERVFLFLYPASRLGLTSPVGGVQGQLGIDRNGLIVPSPGRSSPAVQQQRHSVPLKPRVSVRDLERAVRNAEN